MSPSLVLLLAGVLGTPAVYETGPGPVSASVEVDGRTASLYPAPDGSPKVYLEARAGASYAITLRNRGAERLGVVLDVDGLNAISGDRGSGRMYILDPYESTCIRGWRSSLREVHPFLFVDEARSYASRTGQANEKMGWIEVAVFRERRVVQRMLAPAQPVAPPTGAVGADTARESARGSASEPGAVQERVPADKSAGHFPGTGWGEATEDHATIVSFDPESNPCQRVVVRYEYRSALAALGIFRDRLAEREQGGFARPPRPY